jgi:hypothetical protein
MPKPHPENMRPVVAAPLCTPPELRALAEDVLTAVAKARFVTVASLMAYGGPAGLTLDLVDVWRRSGLLNRGRVQPDPLSPKEIEYVALTSSGARALYAATGKHVEGISAARLKRSSQKRMHDVLVGEVALAVLVLAQGGAIELAGIETDDRKLATSVHLADPGKAPERVVLQADALVMTKGPLGSEALLIEVDRGTTAPRRMQIRYRGYLAWQREHDGPLRDFGTKALRVLTLVPSEARLEKLHAAALDANGSKRSGFLVFGLLDDFTVCTAERWLNLVGRPLGAEPGQRVRLLSPARAARAA